MKNKQTKKKVKEEMGYKGGVRKAWAHWKAWVCRKAQLEQVKSEAEKSINGYISSKRLMKKNVLSLLNGHSMLPLS